MTGQLLTFVTVSLLVIVTPGPDTALTIRNTLLGGRSVGICTAAGVVAGQSVWALASSLGVVTLLVSSEALFLAIKYAGAAYLVLLGLQALRSALGRSAGAPAKPRKAGRSELSTGAAWRQGFLSNLGNPKMAVFFAGLLPQFVAPGVATFGAFAHLGLIFCAMTFAWLSAYAALVAKVGETLSRPGIRRAMESLTGVLLIALGLRILCEER
jgi:threonine/homoserine/homoserine lactone efflux protein